MQDELPLVAEPFKLIAEEIDSTEEEVLARLRLMQETGALRKMGAVLRHREVGFAANALCVWVVPDERMDEVADIMCRHMAVTHCYDRNVTPDWPYNFYTTFTATKGKFTTKEEGEQAFATIEGKPFTVTDVQKKRGTEAPPHLYDLTSLQVDCNRKFGMSADMTLKIIQTLYERKLTTYPRVDTQYLSDDIYPKCGGILNGIKGYDQLLTALRGKPLKKSKKVFDTSKVTDHHAIIPTGVPAQGLTDMERHVYDLIARRFISVFYPDCKFATTTVMGDVDGIEFKATGKLILDPGWRAVYAKDAADRQTADDGDAKPQDEERTLPATTSATRPTPRRSMPTASSTRATWDTCATASCSSRSASRICSRPPTAST